MSALAGDRADPGKTPRPGAYTPSKFNRFILGPRFLLLNSHRRCEAVTYGFLNIVLPCWSGSRAPWSNITTYCAFRGVHRVISARTKLHAGAGADAVAGNTAKDDVTGPDHRAAGLGSGRKVVAGGGQLG
jgi:hypothetical protein